MKRDDVGKIKEKTEVELLKDLASAEEEARKLRADIASGKLKNYNELRETRKKVARILTFLKLKKT